MHPKTCGLGRGIEKPALFNFLDWEKALDRIKQDKLIEALERMRIPNKFIAAIESIYNNPTFTVKSQGGRAIGNHKNPESGKDAHYHHISSLIMMTVIFRDVHDDLSMARGTVDRLSFTELLYADDTVLITNNVSTMNRLLATIEKCALYHGMGLNKTKCVSLTFHCKERIMIQEFNNV